MNICGILVHANPARLDNVVAALAAIEGVELHQSGPDGRLVITVEDTPERSAGDTLMALQRLDGLISTALVYHHFEPAVAADSHD